MAKLTRIRASTRVTSKLLVENGTLHVSKSYGLPNRPEAYGLLIRNTADGSEYGECYKIEMSRDELLREIKTLAMLLDMVVLPIEQALKEAVAGK